jgi:hypothetical protein
MLKSWLAFSRLLVAQPVFHLYDGIRLSDIYMQVKQRRHGEQSRRAYLRELRKVVDHSDVILQVFQPHA